MMQVHTWKNITAIAIGGAVGTVARFFVNFISYATGLPLGTIIVNVIGSFMLGLLSGWVMKHTPKEWVKLGLGVGLCGGFTTMSTLAADTLYLYHHWEMSFLILYLFLSVFAGVTMAGLGWYCGERLIKQDKPLKEVRKEK
ncbi:CrcB family protein [Alkalihalobacillus sp. LMS39]|uniref:fluoride efflux transporter FluC n=1 Tax=Alkalihalobacillus sp. LMS39 TaxID=2924032 RepID=UPI001FB1BCFF|nr:CrcB family protein [Alkalihalobacillus sp. LMS39]UOE93259.1 CrcB family protein [Alkalihalobacillus sp. LMS39]